MRFHIEELHGASAALRAIHGGSWPWQLIGVFPVEGTEMPNEWWSRFMYTVGLSDDYEMWLQPCSIEGRCVDFEFGGSILNQLAAGYTHGPLNDGDEVVVPVGIADDPEAPDVDSIWWIGNVDTREHRGTYQSPVETVIPVLWSSPLGWPE
jgi:hypothetical protein